jgi:hypothetical protein
MIGSIGVLFFLVKGYYGIEKLGLAMRLGKGSGTAAALLILCEFYGMRPIP